MNDAEALPTDLQPLADHVAEQLRLILMPLWTLVDRFYRRPVFDAFCMPLRNRLRRTLTRMERLLARLGAGRLPKPRRPPSKPRAKPSDPAKPFRFPRAYAWLTHALGCEAACRGTQLEYLLSRPEVAALLARDPAALRLLNPIRRMLGQMPQKPRKPRAPRPPKLPGEPMTPYGMAVADWRPTIEHPVYDGKRPWWMPSKRKLRRERAMERIQAERERLRAKKPA